MYGIAISFCSWAKLVFPRDFFSVEVGQLFVVGTGWTPSNEESIVQSRWGFSSIVRGRAHNNNKIAMRHAPENENTERMIKSSPGQNKTWDAVSPLFYKYSDGESIPLVLSDSLLVKLSEKTPPFMKFSVIRPFHEQRVRIPCTTKLGSLSRSNGIKLFLYRSASNSRVIASHGSGGRSFCDVDHCFAKKFPGCNCFKYLQMGEENNLWHSIKKKSRDGSAVGNHRNLLPLIMREFGTRCSHTIWNFLSHYAWEWKAIASWVNIRLNDRRQGRSECWLLAIT